MVVQKLQLAQKYQKPIDGHAPMVTGEALEKYYAAQITTDHECYTLDEAEEKIKLENENLNPKEVPPKTLMH